MNMRIVSLSLAAVATMSSLFFSGCVVERHPRRHVVVYEPAPVVVGTEVIVQEPPPPPRREVIIARPGPAHVWVPGVWVWQGRWVWEAGHWALPPKAGAVWVPHRYVLRGGVHVYVHGGWRF